MVKFKPKWSVGHVAGQKPHWHQFPRKLAKRGIVSCCPGPCGMGRPLEGRLLELAQDGARVVLPGQWKIGQDIELEIAELSCRSGKKLRSTIHHVEAIGEGLMELDVQFFSRLDYRELQKYIF